MTIYAFVEGPLLWIVFLSFLAGIGVRLFLFFYRVVKKDLSSKQRDRSTGAIWGRALLPFHSAALKKPFYTALLYIFHGSLVVVPIWYSGHIVLWEESRLAWHWPAIPDVWADGLTLLTLGIVIFFVLRRFMLRDIRRSSTWTDALLILLTILPFLTGYLLARGQLDHITFFSENMVTIHILSGEAMILMIVFLFCRPIINGLSCTGCAACGINCSTGALHAGDTKNQRTFSYVPTQCIQCGQCVVTCPEKAVSLRHSLDIKTFLQAASRKEIRSVELRLCQKCGVPVAPITQIEKISSQLEEASLQYCSQCKEEDIAETFYRKAAS
jgi:ferredoxin